MKSGSCLHQRVEDLRDELHLPTIDVRLHDLRYRALGSAYRVHSALGPCLREDVYQRCLVQALRNDGFVVETERRIDLEFEGIRLPGALRMDIVVNGALFIEVKACDVPLPHWNAQMLSYLQHSGLPVGCLVNFRVARLRNGIRPYVNIPMPDPSAVNPPRSSQP